MNRSKDYYPAIDGIRAIAILLVVLFHLDFSWAKGGFVGVDVFFVISGFLITRNIMLAIEEQRFSFSQFYSARIRRLFPALLATILVCLIFGILLLSPDALIRLSGSAIASTLSLANVRFWLVADYFDVDAALKPLLHFWSLSVEEQFYLFWPISLWLGARYLNNRSRLLLAVVLVATVSLVTSELYLRSDPSASFYLVQFRAYEFAIGAALFLLPSLVNNVLAKHSLVAEAGVLIGLSLIIVPFLTYSDRTNFPGVNALYPCVGAALLIFFRSSILATVLLANNVMRALGKISYSLYLVHWPVWVYYSYWRIEPLHGLEKMGLFVLMVLLASVLYFCVEKRFRYRSAVERPIDDSTIQVSSAQHKLVNGQAFYPAVLLTLFCVILAGSWSIRQSHGLPQRSVSNYPRLGPVELNCEYHSGKKFQSCQFGELRDYQRTVLLIGDSHSMNLRYGFDRYGHKHSVRFQSLSTAGCPPLLGVNRYHITHTMVDQQCKRFSKQIADAIEVQSVDAVVLVGRWMWYFEHEMYGGRNDLPKSYLGLAQEAEFDVVTLNADSSRLAWQKSLQSTVNAILLHIPKVVVFSQFPLMHKGLGECNQSPPWLISKQSHANRCRLRIPVADIMQRLQFTNQEIEKLAKVNVMVVKPSDYICDSNRQVCDVLSDNGLYYADDNHLSRLGGNFLIDSVSDELAAFLDE